MSHLVAQKLQHLLFGRYASSISVPSKQLVASQMLEYRLASIGKFSKSIYTVFQQYSEFFQQYITAKTVYQTVYFVT